MASIDRVIPAPQLRALNDVIVTLPAKLQRNVMRGALRAGMKPAYDRARELVPVERSSSENISLYGNKPGALKRTIRLATTVIGMLIIASVKAGGKTKRGDAFYAHMVENGTLPHLITPKKGGTGWLVYGHGIFAKVVHHPGARAQPFMRPALDEKAQEGVGRVAAYISARLVSIGALNTPDTMQEGDE